MTIRRLLAMIVCAFALFGTNSAVAQEATPQAVPVADESPITIILNEHNLAVTTLDLGDSGPSIGDMIIWGPNALFDEANENDTGATSQGVCVWFNAEADCLLTETVIFPDGSTIELQGIQPGAPIASLRTIVGGSGEYLGASGTVTVEPSGDLSIWMKTFEIWL